MIVLDKAIGEQGIGERVIGEQENLGASDRGVIEKYNTVRNEQSPKYKIAYVPLDPVADYVYLSDLNTRLRVGCKTLPNLNFKLKFQTQISNSNLNFKT